MTANFMIDYLLFIQCICLCELMHDRFDHTVWLSRGYVGEREQGSKMKGCARVKIRREASAHLECDVVHGTSMCVFICATILEAFVIGCGRNYIARRQIARICNKWCESWRNTTTDPLGVDSLCLYKVWNKYRVYLTLNNRRTILKHHDILTWNTKRH